MALLVTIFWIFVIFNLAVFLGHLIAYGMNDDVKTKNHNPKDRCYFKD